MKRTITYVFDFQDGTSWKYDLTFDARHSFLPTSPGEPANWTRLDFHQCPNCPLSKEQTPHCPVAVNLNSVVEDSKDTISWTKARVSVLTEDRSYSKECTTQDGLRSLFGLLMASSGCPHLDWLRPLARFHLPFASTDETLFRVLSLQLLEDFLIADGGTLTDPQKRISERYKQVEQVNHTFLNRIQSYCEQDADKNALAALDVCVQLFSYELESNFRTLRPYFDSRS